MIENDFVFRAGPKMATVLGINEALVLGMVDYWINKNKENGINYKVDYWINKNKENGINYKNGRYWTFNTLKKWREKYFYFWSERTVQRIFESLEDKGLLIVGNFNKVGFDRTKWYSIDYDRFDELVAEKSDLINKYEMKEVEEELLIVGNFNKVGFDRTKWYSIDYDRFDELVAEKSDLINKYEMKEVEEELEIDMTNCPDATYQVDEMQNDRL